MRHISGRLNFLADSLSSRHQIIGAEWSLHPSLVRQMFSVWYIPEQDLFLTRHNNQLAVFVSPEPDPRAKVDPVGQAMGICLSPNCIDGLSDSQVVSLRSVSNASSGTASASPAVASNASQLVSGLYS